MKTYKRAFDNLQVPPDMLERVCKQAEKPYRRSWRPAAAGLAACAVLALGIWTVAPRDQTPLGSSSQNPVQVGNPYQSLASVQELEDLLPYVLQCPDVPQGYQVEGVALIGGVLAQIDYAQGDSQVSFRMGQGQQNVSGDYTAYPFQIEVTQDGQSGTLSGQGELVSQAVWYDGENSFSLSFAPAVSQQEALEWMGWTE